MKKKILFVINTLGRAGAETALITLLKNCLKTNMIFLYMYCADRENSSVNCPPMSTCSTVISVGNRSSLKKENFFFLRQYS